LHLGILAGPVLWALAAGGTARLLPARATALGDVARTALLLAAGLWSVAFVLDGFVGPKLAASIADAGVSADALAIRAFSVNQLTMARLGMLSIVLVGTAMTAFGASLLWGARAASWTALVGAMGVTIGMWTFVAAFRGEFYPGPFTSQYWSATALSIGIWWGLLGSVVARMRGTEPSATTANAAAPRTSPSSAATDPLPAHAR
jgi:hypothetical protein